MNIDVAHPIYYSHRTWMTSRSNCGYVQSNSVLYKVQDNFATGQVHPPTTII